MRETVCLVAGFDGDVVENEPVEMHSIFVYELDTDSNILQKQSMNRSFQNGDIFSYTASADEGAITGTIQLRILAKNILDETIVNQLAIKFSNECGIPAIEVGDYLGWVIVVSQIHPQFILSTMTNPAHNIFCLGFSCSAIGWRLRIFVVVPFNLANFCSEFQSNCFTNY